MNDMSNDITIHGYAQVEGRTPTAEQWVELLRRAEKAEERLEKYFVADPKQALIGLSCEALIEMLKANRTQAVKAALDQIREVLSPDRAREFAANLDEITYNSHRLEANAFRAYADALDPAPQGEKL